MRTDIASRNETGTAIQIPSEVKGVLERIRLIRDLMREAMVPGVDFGVIPGTNSKPTLLKPGAEKLAVMFKLAPKYETTKTFHDDGHLTVECTCAIVNGSGEFLGEASAMCSTRESKYRYRGGARLCPECKKPTIIKGRKEYGGGFLCFAKKGGCGAKFKDDDPAITSQSEQKVENPDIADSYNTVLRIAEKRALLGAIRLVTGSSALFDEEIPGGNERDDAQADRQQQPEQSPPDNVEEPPPEDPETLRLKDEWIKTCREAPLDIVNSQGLAEYRATPDPTMKAWRWKTLWKIMVERGFVLGKDSKYALPTDGK